MIRSLIPFSVLMTTVVIFSLLHAAVNDARERKVIELTVRPRIALAPADVSLTIRLVPDMLDRYVRVWTDGENYSRSSSFSVEPSEKPQFFTVEWMRVFGGEYDITASVADQRGIIRASDVQRMLLQSP